MSEIIEAYPLHWPTGKPKCHVRERSRFKVAFTKARDELMRELELLNARKTILSTNIPLRRDGLPYANEKRPADPGVAIYFEYKTLQMCFACDRWDRVEDNIQAIRHTISALRGIARWGTGDMLQAAFTGFTALPAPKPKKHWTEVLGMELSPISKNKDKIREAYKNKVKEVHPDLGGVHASTESFIELQQAYEQALKEVA